uniref:RNase H type-1 domain-containing protein n=1 Tax=Panagrolaimus sp. JU765 TaxID=591449 RepID=A0AC34RRQ7_9BILA
MLTFIPRTLVFVRKSSLSTKFEKTVVYTDGACSRNGTPLAAAGYGVYWGDGHEDNVAAPVSGAPTSIRAEYEAVCVALDQARK